MLGFLSDVVGGWREVRAIQGYSYQVSRDGRRRAVPIEDYGRRGTIDQAWIATGEFSDEQMHRRFRNYNLKRQLRAQGRLQTA